MKELKKASKKYIENWDLCMKPFLALSEIEEIGNEVLKYDNYAERECVLNILLCKCVTDMQEDEEWLSKNYDLLVENHFFSDIRSRIANISDLYNYIKFEDDINRQVIKKIDALLLNINNVLVKIDKKVEKTDVKELMAKLIDARKKLG